MDVRWVPKFVPKGAGRRKDLAIWIQMMQVHHLFLNAPQAARCKVLLEDVMLVSVVRHREAKQMLQKYVKVMPDQDNVRKLASWSLDRVWEATYLLWFHELYNWKPESGLMLSIKQMSVIFPGLTDFKCVREELSLFGILIRN
jgi:hypothetical protein